LEPGYVRQAVAVLQGLISPVVSWLWQGA